MKKEFTIVFESSYLGATMLNPIAGVRFSSIEKAEEGIFHLLTQNPCRVYAIIPTYKKR